MSGYTPGPWLQSHRKSVYGGYRTEIYTDNGEVVATVAWYPRRLNETTTTTDRAANARLMAGAPVLLEACRSLLAAYEEAHALYDLGECDGSLLARAAIAKATGETA